MASYKNFVVWIIETAKKQQSGIGAMNEMLVSGLLLDHAWWHWKSISSDFGLLRLRWRCLSNSAVNTVTNLKPFWLVAFMRLLSSEPRRVEQNINRKMLLRIISFTHKFNFPSKNSCLLRCPSFNFISQAIDGTTSIASPIIKDNFSCLR